MSSPAEELIAECALALAEVVTEALKGAAAPQVDAIKQALSGVAAAIREVPASDPEPIAAAIRGLQMTVNVKPTPVQVHVPEQAERPFRPLLMRVLSHDRQGRIETVQITQEEG